MKTHHRLETWCTCGAALDVRGMTARAVDRVAAAFAKVHAGDGHAPASAHQAARARASASHAARARKRAR